MNLQCLKYLAREKTFTKNVTDINYFVNTF